VATQSRTVEEILGELARRSHGVVTRQEILRNGVTPAELLQRVEIGALIRVHRGVFRVGHRAPSLEAHYMAAVRACGAGSLLAGRAAAHLFALLKDRPSLPEVLTRSQRQPKGVLTHRARRSDLDDATEWRGIPVTTIARTLVDLAALLPPPALARAFHEAAIRHRTTPDSVEAVLARRQNWPGARALRGAIWGHEPVSLSKLESSFIARVRGAGLPLPETNRCVDARYVDCRWPAHRLTAELDSYRYHHTRHAWEQDRQREREARARGDEFRRYTWHDVDADPESMLTDLRHLLGRPPLGAARAGY
jgi:Transcriptional regulator, AbiEi antitoxin